MTHLFHYRRAFQINTEALEMLMIQTHACGDLDRSHTAGAGGSRC